MFTISKIKFRIKKFIVRQVNRILEDPDFRFACWKCIGAINRPNNGMPMYDVSLQIWKNSLATSAHYVEQHMMDIHSSRSRPDFLNKALSSVKLEGLYMEFGVHTGISINFIANYLAAQKEKIVHGFDSFQGLPENWFNGAPAGVCGVKGQIPEILPNVKLHVGWFSDTLPKFAANNKEKITFMHIDCDLYSSTKTVFDSLGQWITSGTVIVFDEYFNYPEWEKHEYKAFQEFIKEKNLTYIYIAWLSPGYSVAVKIL